MGAPPSAIRNLAVDPPLLQNAGYRFDAQDRAYIDDQVRGCQSLIVQCLATGTVMTWVRVDTTSSALAVGNAVALFGTAAGSPAIKLALAAVMTNSPCVYGIVVIVGAPGALALVAIEGAVPQLVTGIAVNVPGVAVLNTSTAGYTVIDTPHGATVPAGSYVVGAVNGSGDLTLARATVSQAGGGAGTVPTGTGWYHVTGSAADVASVTMGDSAIVAGAFVIASLTGAAGTLVIAATAAIFSWATGATLPTLTQAIAGSGVTPKNFVWAPQAPNAASTTQLANTPGFAVVNLAAANTLTVAGLPAQFQVQQAGSALFGVQTLVGSPAITAIYFNTAATTPAANNYTVWGDGTSTALNGTSAVSVKLNANNILDASASTVNLSAGGIARLTLNGASGVASFQNMVGLSIGALDGGMGGGSGVVFLGNAATFPTAKATAGGILAHDTIGLHYTPPDATSFIDYMLAPVMQGTANSQLLKKREYFGAVRTVSTAAATTILTIPIPSGSGVSILVTVRGRDVTGGTVGDEITRTVLYSYRNTGGTIFGTTATNAQLFGDCHDTSMATCTCVAAINAGAGVFIQVNGLAAATVDWSAVATVVLS